MTAKKVETIQTAIETKAKINLANDLDKLHEVFMSNVTLLENIPVRLPEDTCKPRSLAWAFCKDNSIRALIVEFNIERYVQNETNRLLEEVEETKQDLGQLRNVITKDLMSLRATLNPEASPAYDTISEKIKQVLCKINGE